MVVDVLERRLDAPPVYRECEMCHFGSHEMMKGGGGYERTLKTNGTHPRS